MSNNNGSNISPIAALINGAMKDATTSGNRSAALIVAMFQSEATFSKSIILNAFQKEGADKTDMIDDLICIVSEDFMALRNQYDVMTHKDNKAKVRDNHSAKERLAFETVAVLGKIKAARMMVTRALSAVYYLRDRDCTKLIVNKIGTGALVASIISDDEDMKGERTTLRIASTALTAAGDKLLREHTGKAKNNTGRGATAKNPVASALADSSKALAAVLTGVNATDKGPKALTDFSNDVEQQLEVTLKELFTMKFFDGKSFDVATFNEWTNSQFGFSMDKRAVKNVAKNVKEQKAAA